MERIKKGDIVGRKSYGKDIIFVIKKIIDTPQCKVAILRGLIDRIEADSNLDDLELIDRKTLKKEINYFNNKLDNRIKHNEKHIKNKEYKIGLLLKNNRTQEKIVTGKILHLDGDKRYSEKSYRYYRKLGLKCIVKNIPEYRQPKVVYRMLEEYNPDILVITGHDGMIKRGTDYNNIYNYRNSKYFIETVKEARRYDSEKQKDLVIFARSMPKLF